MGNCGRQTCWGSITAANNAKSLLFDAHHYDVGQVDRPGRPTVASVQVRQLASRVRGIANVAAWKPRKS